MPIKLCSIPGLHSVRLRVMSAAISPYRIFEGSSSHVLTALDCPSRRKVQGATRHCHDTIWEFFRPRTCTFCMRQPMLSAGLNATADDPAHFDSRS